MTEIDLKVSSGGRFERLGSYSRVRRVGAAVFVAGTTAIESSGRLHAPGDCYAQTRFILARIADWLSEAGASLDSVVRTRAYLVAGADVAAFARAHGEVFAGIEPVCTAIGGAVLTMPGMVVEIEAEAIVR